ncbi:MAG: hypothetical protein AAB257_06900 [Nitrospinota bacterium]
MRNIFRIAFFVGFFFAADRFLGWGLENLFFKIEVGDEGGYINNAIKNNYDIYIFGSSRAHNHFDPSVIRGILKMSSFNVARAGSSLAFADVLSSILLETKKDYPEYLILEVSEDDLMHDKEKERLNSVRFLMPYLDKSQYLYDQMILYGGIGQRIKLFSKAYRYNSKLMPIIMNSIVTPSQDGLDSMGFLPLEGLVKDFQFSFSIEYAFPSFSSEMEDHLRLFIRRTLARKIKCIIVSSPKLFRSQGEMLRWELSTKKIREIVEKEKAIYFEYSLTHKDLFQNPQLYRDFGHLNREGAKLFSQLFSEDLKASFEK